jgi:pimeloyl-ACP methyl ester carboxylesterase
VLDAAGVARAHVLGLSMGGMIAQDFAIRHGDRLGALVLAATYARPDRGIAETGGTVDFAKLDVKQIFRALIGLVLTPEFITREKQWLRGVMQRALESGATVENFLAQVSAVMHHDASAELAALRAPTLVLTGTKDLLVPAHHSDVLARLIPHARLVKIEDGSHGFNIEMKDRFNQTVLDFLAEHPLGS